MKTVSYAMDHEDTEPGACEPLHESVCPQTSAEPGAIGRYKQSTKARQHWKAVRRHVDHKAHRRDSIGDKWVRLTRSLSNEMGGFFVSTDLDARKIKADWSARSNRLRQRSILQIRTKPSEQRENSIAMQPMNIDSIYSVTEEEDEAEAPVSGWICRTSEGRFSLHSRQQSHISTASSKRVTRARPSLKLEKDSVFRMALNGIKNMSRIAAYIGNVPQPEESVTRSRSITPASFVAAVSSRTSQADEYVNDLFFDVACPTSPEPMVDDEDDVDNDGLRRNADYASFNSFDSVDVKPSALKPRGAEAAFPHPDEDIMRPKFQRQEPPRAIDTYRRRLPDEYVKAVPPNNDRRQFGIGMVGNLIGTDYRESRLDSDIYEEMSQLRDYRPFFTYWVTFIQIVIYIFTIAVYDLAPVSETDITGEVRMTSAAKGIAHYKEPGNMWFGPSQSDLVHLGAKYSPCMRLDKNVINILEIDRQVERRSGCCVYNDGSGCAQMVESRCSKTFASWKNMTVCGQDPEFCLNSSIHSLRWSVDDITEWPICLENSKVPEDGPMHLTCEVIARPCCIGIHGRCIITTSEECEFRKGYFHPEATLCSQVKTCMSELCGMLPFSGHPNQFYRLWTSLFLHAGLVQLFITVVLQFLVLRDLEKLLGWLRIGFIYIFSGIAGSLASAIFLPYQAEAGPSGSQFSIIACLFVEVIQNWKVIDRPFIAVGKLGLILIFLFIAGLMPWVDNYAHLFGFIFGFLLSFALMPYVDFNILSKRGRIISVTVCLLLVAGIFSVLAVLFYVSPISSCSYCHFFNCIPFTRSFCKSTEVSIENIEP